MRNIIRLFDDLKKEKTERNSEHHRRVPTVSSSYDGTDTLWFNSECKSYDRNESYGTIWKYNF